MQRPRSIYRMGFSLSGGLLAAALANSVAAQAPATRPAVPPAVAQQEPAYSRSTPITDEMIDRRPRQVIALPSEPGEYGEDRLQRSSGVLGKLPPDVHRLPEGYVVASREMSVEYRPDWLVCYLPDERLMKLSRSEAEGWAGELDQQQLPADLVKACQAQDLTLAPESKVEVEEQGKRWRVVDPRRTLIIQQDRDGMVVRFALELRILPNKRLAMLEAVLGGTEGTPSFAFTGRVTEFQGKNYILTEHLAEVVEAPEVPVAEEEVRLDETATAPAGEPRPEDIIKQLLEKKPRRAVPLPQNMPGVAPGRPVIAEPGTDAKGDQVWPEETILVDQPGRIVPGDKWWTFTFEDKGHHPNRRPIRLLPNRMLENAIVLAGDESMGVVLLVSGEVTEYQGANYLLLRKVLVQREWGNLR